MRRITQLDGVRGIAILLVLVWHYFYCPLAAAPPSLLAYCRNAFLLAWSGVDLFFVLSGFLIVGILLDNCRSPYDLRVFFIRRACRIFPLYYLLLGLFVLLSETPLAASPTFRDLFHDPFPLWSYATFTQNFLMGAQGGFGAPWLGITWSLAIEEQFYLLIPWLVFFLSRRTLFCALLLLILLAPALRFASGGFHAFVLAPWRSDALLSGALLAVLVRWPPFLPLVRMHRRLVMLLLGVMLALVAAITIRPGLLGALPHFFLAALYALFVLVAFSDIEPLLGRVLQSPLLVWFGHRAYGIYLFHIAIGGLLFGALRGGGQRIVSLPDAGITILALFSTLLIADMSYRYFEEPILRFGHRVHYHN